MKRFRLATATLLWLIAMMFSVDVYASRSVDDAIGWASIQVGSNADSACQREWANWCMHFCGHVYGLSQSGFNYAIDGWDSPEGTLGQKHFDRDFCNIPRGALVFFSTGLSPNGHVGVSLGNGQMIHAWTSGVIQSNIDSSPYSTYYLGWRWPVAWTPDTYSFEVATKSTGEFCWAPQNATCSAANSWYRIVDDAGNAIETESSICSQAELTVETIAAASSGNCQEETPDGPWWQSWWRAFLSLWGYFACANEVDTFTVNRIITVAESRTRVTGGTGYSATDSVGSGNTINSTDAADPGKPDFVITKTWLNTQGGTEQYTFNPGQAIVIYSTIKNKGSAGCTGTVKTGFAIFLGGCIL